MRSSITPRTATGLATMVVLALLLGACAATTPDPEQTPGASTPNAQEPQRVSLTVLQHIDRYLENIWYDFSDAFQLGIGFALTNSEEGWPKPYPGFYFQMTDFCKLGAMHYYGWSAEIDGRGYFAGPEVRTRFSLGPLDALRLDQKYDRGWENYFKKGRTRWAARMQSDDMMWGWTPAKELRYDIWADRLYRETLCFPRGWQHWSNTSMEVGMIFMQMRMGLDIVELHEWLLSLFAIDVLGDDLTPAEYLEKQNYGAREAAAPIGQ